jgi:hypothetical protein
MSTILEPLEQALAADVTAPFFEVTYTPDAQGNGTIQIPVSISSDGASLAVKCPPVAIPIGTWNLVWDFTLDPNVPPVLISISQLLDIPEFVSVAIPPPTQPIDSSQLLPVTATVKNQLQPRTKPDVSTEESFNGFGYWIRVDCESLNPALHNSSLAVVQDLARAEPGGPKSFTLAYTMDPVSGSRLKIPVFAWLAAGDVFVAKAPPAALPIGPWTIEWDFKYDPIPAEEIELSVLGLENVADFFALNSGPKQTSPTSCEALATNLLEPAPLPETTSSVPPPASQQLTAFAYFLHVTYNRAGLLAALAIWDPSIAVVQDPIVG